MLKNAFFFSSGAVLTASKAPGEEKGKIKKVEREDKISLKVNTK